MPASRKIKKGFRFLIPTVIVLLIIPVCGRTIFLRHKDSFQKLSGDSLYCVIAVNDDRGSSGLKAGYSFEMLKAFSKDCRCKVTIEKADPGVDYFDSLKAGVLDILVTAVPDSLEMDSISFSVPVGEEIIWAVKRIKRHVRLKEINSWISHYTNSAQYGETKKRFFTSYNPYKMASSGRVYSNLSPYDEIIKKQAGKLKWDWKLLTAVIYQESGFCIDTRSRRGALGLMQVMPKTASRFEADNLLDPEDNISTGVSYIARLQRMFTSRARNKAELEKLTLAAYNAGEGRILDCINYASTLEKDNDTWDALVDVIPQMRTDSILQVDTVKLGVFKGVETIKYVDQVLELYQSFSKVHLSADSHGVGRVNSRNK